MKKVSSEQSVTFEEWRNEQKTTKIPKEDWKSAKKWRPNIVQQGASERFWLCIVWSVFFSLLCQAIVFLIKPTCHTKSDITRAPRVTLQDLHVRRHRSYMSVLKGLQVWRHRGYILLVTGALVHVWRPLLTPQGIRIRVCWFSVFIK